MDIQPQDLPRIAPPPAVPTPAPQAMPSAYPGLKRPPPAIGTTVNGMTYMGGDPRSADPKVWRPATGDTFLNSLPMDDNKKTVIKAIANYDLPPGSQRGGIGSPEVQQLLGFAKQYDPSFSAQDYSVRQGVRNDFAKGKYSQTITALNTAIDHARGLADNTDALHNSSFPLWNAAGNWVDENVLGDNRQTNYRQTAQLEAGELVKAITGAQGGEEDRRQQEANFPLNGSPSQQQGAITNSVSLLKSKLDELNATYQRGMGSSHSIMDLLSPTARKSWSELTKRYGAATPDGQPAAASPSTSAAAKVSSDADYAKLPSGSVFVGPDGRQRRKP